MSKGIGSPVRGSAGGGGSRSGGGSTSTRRGASSPPASGSSPAAFWSFVSPRDQQPFVFVRSGGSGPGDVLAYEKIGEGGKHYIVTPMGASFELDEAELKRRVPSAK